jgi:hypothetical protein
VNIGGELSQRLVMTIGNVCTDRAAAARTLTSFDAIFVGSHRIGGALRPGVPSALPWCPT